MLHKNTSTYPVDCGGLMLPSGATADLDPTSPVIVDHVTSGRLTPVQPVPAAQKPRTSKETD